MAANDNNKQMDFLKLNNHYALLQVNIQSDDDNLDKKFLDETLLPKNITNIIKTIDYGNKEVTKVVKTKKQAILEKILNAIGNQIKKRDKEYKNETKMSDTTYKELFEDNLDANKIKIIKINTQLDSEGATITRNDFDDIQKIWAQTPIPGLSDFTTLFETTTEKLDKTATPPPLESQETGIQIRRFKETNKAWKWEDLNKRSTELKQMWENFRIAMNKTKMKKEYSEEIEKFIARIKKQTNIIITPVTAEDNIETYINKLVDEMNKNIDIYANIIIKILTEISNKYEVTVGKKELVSKQGPTGILDEDILHNIKRKFHRR